MSETPQFIDDVVRFVADRKARGDRRVYLTPEVRRALFDSDETTVADKPVRSSGPTTASANPQPASPVAAEPKQAVPPPHPVAPTAPPAAVVSASGKSIEELQKCVQSCVKCPLHEGRAHVVFGEGDPNAELMFIGEGPDADEDRTGRPFVGRAGQLLTKMIEAMQFSREQVYITNIIKCRPPGNRNPTDDEAMACLPYLKRQIELIQPSVIVLLGGVALQHLLGEKSIMRSRGQWQSCMGIPTMPTYHPSFLLRSPNRKKEAWLDLQEVMKRLGKDPRKTKK